MPEDPKVFLKRVVAQNKPQERSLPKQNAENRQPPSSRI